jgi:hypothetical protein
MAVLTCLTAGALSFALWPIWLFLLTFPGLPDQPWDQINVLSRFLAFPFFLVSLASLRWSCVLIWADFVLGWIAGLAVGWPHGRLSPFSASGSFIQFCGALLITASCLLISGDITYSDATRKNPNLVKLFRRNK